MALFAVSIQVAAKGAFGLSSNMSDSRTLSIQRKVEKLFNKGNFDRAFFIYRNELVPIGDKYAQYMVGFMYETGLGVEQDVVSASAWYRLAAEQDTPEFLVVRDRLMGDFTDEQRRRSDTLVSVLHMTLSDMAVLIASIEVDVAELESRTGSRLRGESSPVSVIDARSGIVRSGADYYGGIERRLADRLERLANIPGFEDIDTKPKTVNVTALKKRVKEHLLKHNNL